MYLHNAMLLDIYVVLFNISMHAFVYDTFHRSVDRNSTDMPVRRNLSYATTPSHSTRSGTQATQAIRAADQCETDAATDYSRIGPLYETIDSRRQQPAVEITGRDQISSQLLERYEFSETHLAAAGGSGGVQSEGDMDYEVPQNLSMRQIEEHDSEEYSHLQH